MTHIVIFTVLLLLVCSVVCYCFYEVADQYKQTAEYWKKEYEEARNKYLEERKNKMKV